MEKVTATQYFSTTILNTRNIKVNILSQAYVCMYFFLSFMSITYIKYLYGKSSISAFSINNNMFIAMTQFFWWQNFY